MIRKVATPRKGGAIHYFIVGSEQTVCGLQMDDRFVVKGEDVPMSCQKCVEVVARAKREEQAS